MLCYEVYEMVLDLVRKDKRGRSLDIDEFNRVAKIVNAEVYAHYYRLYETSLESSDALDAFKIGNHQITLSAVGTASAIGTLPSDYYTMVGVPRYIDGSDIREVDVVTAIEFTKRQVDYLTRPTTKNPIMALGGADGSGGREVVVLPNTITAVRMDYLKEAATPFLDYYVNDTTLEYTYIAAGATPTVPSGSTYRDGSAGSYAVPAALTVDFDWTIDDISLILSLFVQKLGLQLGDELMIQVGNSDEVKTMMQ
jgi:hypothetical protein